MFDNFTLEHIDLGEVTVRVRFGGTGPAVLLLHGHPRTSATWHRVAPLLAEHHTVVCPDLRGYGQSSKPPTTEDHAPYARRAMAGDAVALMRALGHERFAIAGHDRGAGVAYRTALDHPAAVSKLAVLDGLPVVEILERCDARFAAAWWHWFFFAQPDKPERAINADPLAWYGGSPEAMGAEAYEDFRAAVTNPDTVFAMLEDYRAGLGLDRLHDEQDRSAGRRIQCPVLALWSRHDDLADLFGDVVGIWRNWADDVRGGEIDSGHHMAEEAPEELATALLEFFAR